VYGYEKAGLEVRHEPIPWNAETVVVEALVDFPDHLPCFKSDFHLGLPGETSLKATALQREKPDGRVRVVFRLTPLRKAAVAYLYWRARPLGEATLPSLSAAEFLDNLELEAPTLFAHLGRKHVPCQAVVEGQCHGLTACGLLKSPTSLLPLLDLNLALEFIDQSTGKVQNLPVHLAAAQLTARQALVSAVPYWRPQADCSWLVRWLVDNRPLACRTIRVISPEEFQLSLYLANGRSPDENEVSRWEPAVPLRYGASRPGPCFLIASREPNVAAFCPLEVRVQLHDRIQVVEPQGEEALVTDVPSPFVPASTAFEDLPQIHDFELFSQGQSLGVVSWGPTPAATFTGEGGFQPPEDFTWTPFADAELHERMCRLMETPS
jgi:hypothetical protein